MADLIYRDAVIDCLDSNAFDSYENAVMTRHKIEDIPAVNRWIPCSERLPEVDTNVLIYYPKWIDAPVQTAHIMLDETCWEFSDGEFYPSKSEITHWMPLPEPPEKE